MKLYNVIHKKKPFCIFSTSLQESIPEAEVAFYCGLAPLPMKMGSADLKYVLAVCF